MHVVEELVEGIPWYAKYALIVGGALMSAFASTFPESVQTLGRDLGVGLALLGCVAVVWHWTNVWREKHDKPRLKLEATHFIILGLLIALVAAGVQLYRGSPKVGDISPTQDAETHLRLQFATGTVAPNAVETANIWRWYALQQITAFIGPQNQRTEVKTWNLFITMDKPIDLKQVIIESNKPLPQYEVKDRDSRSVVIAFMGEVSNTLIEVRLLTTTSSVKPHLELTNEPQTPPSAQGTEQAPLTIPRSSYTERDIREMLDALDEAQDLVEKKLMPLWEPTQNRLINEQYLLTTLGLKETIAGLNESKDTLQTKVWPSINNFVYKEHSGYQNEMRIALALDDEAAKGELTRAIQAIIDRLKLFPENPDKIEPKALGLVQSEYERAEQLNNQFWAWLVLAQSRIKEMKKNLREKGVTGYEAQQH